MAGFMRVRCVNNRPFLRERGGALVREFGSGEMVSLTRGRVYEVLNMERGWYRIVDDTGDDYIYPPDIFEIVD